MNRAVFSALVPFLFLFAGGCAGGNAELHRYEFNEPRMGAAFRIVLYAPDPTTADRAARAAFDRVDQLDPILNDYDPNSEISRLSQRTLDGPMTQPVKVSSELFFVLQRSYEVGERTGGAFDVTVGPFSTLWRRSRDLGQLPTPQRLDQARAAVGYRYIKLDPKDQTVQLLAAHMKLDIAGLAVGYIVDEALAAVQKQGVGNVLIDAGGDLGVRGKPPGTRGWRVGIQSLEKPEEMTGEYVELDGGSISTSGDTYRFAEIGGKRYSHILDPRTGLGLTNRIGVTVVARDGITCDWLDTAVSVLGREKGTAVIESIPGAAARITTIDDAGRITVSETSRFPHYLAAAPRPTATTTSATQPRGLAEPGNPVK
jgi:thiamine biosynthesis lipoprotein